MRHEELYDLEWMLTMHWNEDEDTPFQFMHKAALVCALDKGLDFEAVDYRWTIEYRGDNAVCILWEV